ncbi:hypothetical protein C8A06_1449 [Microbacteriaceae bacterium MWH-Ta3]|nr:hypothetical protein C8A06_1449 [Microbacteriaceae bacterium MWH-Ta3]
MSKAVWFVTGFIGGLALAHFVARDPRGKALLDEVDARTTEFLGGLTAGYASRDDDNRRTAE